MYKMPAKSTSHLEQYNQSTLLWPVTKCWKGHLYYLWLIDNHNNLVCCLHLAIKNLLIVGAPVLVLWVFSASSGNYPQYGMIPHSQTAAAAQALIFDLCELVHGLWSHKRLFREMR